LGLGFLIIALGGGGKNLLKGMPPQTTRLLLISYNANYLWGQEGRERRADSTDFITTLNRHLDLMDSLGLRVDYYFTGLAAKKLAQWSPATLNRLLNAGHAIHYHGANRPPYPQLVEQIRGENWEEDVATARTYEAEGINPATGEYVGGIKAFREVFGRDPFATGRFFEASILYVDKELGARMAVGLKDNTGASRDDAWFLGVLIRPTLAGLSASGLMRAALQGHQEQYLAYARQLLSRVGGPMPLAMLPIHDHDFFAPIPPNREKVWALYRQVLFMALEMGFQVVTMPDIYRMVQNHPAPTISREALRQAAQTLIQTMEASGYPPEYLTLGEAYYSLAEIFEGLARSLAEYHTTARLPDSVATHDLLGPTEPFASQVASGSLPLEKVLEAAMAVTAALEDRLPARIEVNQQVVNPAEFLYLMAQAYETLTQGRTHSVSLRAIQPLPSPVMENQEADPLTKLQFWTFKPAIYAVEVTSVEQSPGRGEAAPTSFVLEQNYPNPFNPATIIPFTLRQRGHVSLKVYNLLGQEVATLVDDILPAGRHTAIFEARDLPAGVYFYRLKQKQVQQVKKALLVK